MFQEHPKLGARGTVKINTANRADARAWLSSAKVSSHIYNSLSVGQLNGVYNDTTDAQLNGLIGTVPAPFAEAVAAAKPELPELPSANVDQDKLRQIGELLGGLAGGKVEATDLEPVYECIRKLDEHVGGALGNIDDRVKTIEGLADDIRDLTIAIKSDKGGSARAATVARSSTNPILAKIVPNYKAGTYNGGINVSLESPAGFGKSFAVRELGREYDVYLEHGCSEDIDEVSTLLGSITPAADKGLISVDGVLTEAVRAASNEKTTLLLFDEHLRWSTRTQEFLLTFLTGFHRDGTHYYRLRTRKPNGDTLEVLECEAKFLHIIAASNLEQRIPRGPYWDRFLHRRVDFDLKLLTEVCQSILTAHGIKGEALASVFADIIGDSRKAAATNAITFPVSPRVLVRAAVSSPEATEASVAELAAECVGDHVQSWDPDLGDRVHDGGKIAEWVKRLKAVAKIKK